MGSGRGEPVNGTEAVGSATQAWAVRLPRAAAPAAGAIRLLPGVQVCEAGDELWLRGDGLDDALELALRKIPGAKRFTTDTRGRLFPPGARLPKGRLPDAGWLPLSQWLAPRPQTAALQGRMPPRIALRLVRSDRERRANVLVTALGAWAEYVRNAPLVRLKPLRFAASADGRVLVRGEPLPPIPGERCVERDGLAVPAGLEWSPPVDPAVLRDVLGLEDGDLALLDAEAGHERVFASDFVQASRESVRLTLSPSG